MSLRDILGAAHGGGTAEWSFVAKFLKDEYIDGAKEIERRKEAQKRDAFYEGKGEEHIGRLIDTAFQDAETRKLRKAMIPWGKYNNVLRRVSSELATVYNEPAVRWIDAEGSAYKELQDAANLDAAMRRVDEMLVYHEDVWVQYRVRKSDAAPIVDVISPARFWAVCDPADATRLVAIILDQTQGVKSKTAPHYRVWTDAETFQLDKECNFITSSLEENRLRRLPGVLATTRDPAHKGRLLAESPAADLTAAHEAIWFLNVLLIKETKSANNQTYVTGDTSAATMGQSADTEREAVLPEGVTIQSVNRGVDLNQFIATATTVIETAAANHGLPPSVLHQRDAASGAEIHLRRIPIRELRKKRLPIMRRIERTIAGVMADVNALDLPALAFNVAGWGMDFGEVQQPLTEAEQDGVFEQRRRLGLTNTIEEIMRRNPDMTEEAAVDYLTKNIVVEQNRIEAMRALMAASGAMGTPNDSQPVNLAREAAAEEAA